MGSSLSPSAVRQTQRALCHHHYGTGNQCPKGRQGSHSLCPKAPQAPTPYTPGTKLLFSVGGGAQTA